MGQSNTDEGAIVYPLLGVDDEHCGLTVATSLARVLDVPLVVLQPGRVAPMTPLKVPREELENYQTTVEEEIDAIQRSDPDLSVSGTVRVGHEMNRIIAEAAADCSASAVVVPDLAFASRFTRSGTAGRLADQVACDVVSVGGAGQLQNPRSILVPITDGPHFSSTIATATVLALATDAWLEVLHIIPEDPTEIRRNSGETLLHDAGVWADAITAMADTTIDVDSQLLESESVVKTILKQAVYHDAMVIGGSRKGRFERIIRGSRAGDIGTSAEVPVLMAWGYGASTIPDRLDPVTTRSSLI